MKRSFLSLYILAGVSAMLAVTAQAKPGNILLIIADDLGSDSFALTNDDPEAVFPNMPHVEGLATQGVVFEQAYAYPTCSPSRAAMLSGRYGFRTGVGFAVDDGEESSFSEEEVTLADAISEYPSSYGLANIGKWHLGDGLDDPNILGGWPYFSGSLQGHVEDYYDWEKVVNGEVVGDSTVYATQDNVDDTLDFIDSLEDDQPWFIWLAFNAPHDPYQAPPDGTYTPVSPPLTDTEEDVDARSDVYFRAMAESMDYEIGRLLESIDLANTTVIFIGDNGTAGDIIQPPYTVNHGKATLYEGGTKVPLIIAGKGVTLPGRRSEVLVHEVDLFLTILELAEIDTEEALEGVELDSVSLMPVLSDPTKRVHRPLVYTESFTDDGSLSFATGTTMRNGRYKLIQFTNGIEQLFDLNNDVNEEDSLLPGLLTADQAANYYTLKEATTLLVDGYDGTTATFFESWFGASVFVENWPACYTEGLGWFWVTGDAPTPDGFWAWHPGLGWLWTGRDNWPWFYAAVGGWSWYYQGSQWFYRGGDWLYF